MAAPKKPTYAEAIEELERIVREIESEGVDVDQLAKQVSRAKLLITFCKGRLRETEQEVNKVLAEIESEPGAEQSPESETAEEGLF